jgi:hypothetical protein
MNLISSLDVLAAKVSAGDIGSADAWGGADVIICEVAPEPTAAGFYPDPRYVETSHVGQVSWMFEQIRDIFWKQDGYGAWKEELFGRLGNVVKFQTDRNKDVDVKHLVASLLHEAYVLAEEIEDNGELETLMITTNNRILDDLIQHSEKSAMLTPEETDLFLQSLLGE